MSKEQSKNNPGGFCDDSLFHAIFQNARDAIAVHNAGTLMLEMVNKSMEEMYEASFEEIVQSAPGDFSANFPPYDEEHAFKLLQKAIQEGVQQFEWLARKKSGELFWVEVTLKKFEFQGEYKIIAMIRDINERKKIEKELFQRRDSFKAIFNSAFQFIGLLSSDGILLEANNTALNFVGKEEHEVVGKLFWETPWWNYSRDVQEKLQQAIEHAATGKLIRYETIFNDKDGNQHLFDFSLKPVVNSDNEVTFIIPEARDITDRKKAEDALQRRNKLYFSLFEGSLDGIVFVSLDGFFKDCNSSFEKITGYTIDELRSMHFNDITPEKWHQWERREIVEKQLLKYDCSETYQKEYIRKDGVVIPVELTIYKLPRDATPDGEDLYWAVVRDITERKQAENKLIEAQKMDSIGNLAGGVAHDFNNMLAGIRGYVNLLQLKEDDPEKRDFLDCIMKAVMRSKELTQKLLAFGRRGKNIVEAIDLNAVVNEVLAIIERSIHEDITVKCDLDAILKTVDADPGQMNQVVMNLALNAAESMQNGGELYIQTLNLLVDDNFFAPIAGMTHGKYVCLIIKDTGCGIPEDIKSHIYEPFFSTKKEGHIEGTGLGLSTVYGIIKAHKGFVDFESQEGQGTVFKVYLPIGHKRAKANAEDAVVKQTSKKRHVLIVEDEPIPRNMMIDLMKELGHQVSDASNGQDAIELHRQLGDSIDLVFLDVRMPKVGGKETLRYLIDTNPYLPIYIMSGYGHNEEVNELLELGAQGFISKPFSVQSIIDIIENC